MWNAKLNAVVPVAKIKFKQAAPTYLEVIPVVFISNNALVKTANDSIKKMAFAIAQLLHAYQPVVKKNIKEIQIDCDWTLSTKEKYFLLLNELKKQFNPQLQWSATIRLHQIKYAGKTGIPPVQKGMLMYYNMGNLNSTKSNSIFNEFDAEKYAPYIKQYPLPLDAALPVFSWLKVFRNNQMHELLNQLSKEELMATQHFKKLNNNTLQATQMGHYKGFYYLVNDIIVAEESNPQLSQQAAIQLNNYFHQQAFTLALFQLDQIKLSPYVAQDFENLYSAFN